MIIWITGASSGIGLETARQYAKAGHTVLATARNENALLELSARSEAFDGQIMPYPADVTKVRSMKAVYDKMVEQYGVPDKVILNAGTHKPTSAKKFKLTDHKKLMDINYGGVLNGLDLILPDFIDRGSGQIAVVSSVAGYVGLPFAGAYGASKAALINLCESMKAELADHGVDLRIVNPGFVKTPLTDLNKFEMPFLMPVEEAVKAMIKGLDQGASFEITFPSRMAWIMKFLRLLPYALFIPITRKIYKG